MISGPREARPSRLRRLVSRAIARELSAFVVPGPEVARARGLAVEEAGLRVAATPRHANVLLVVGELPRGLKEAATVAYSQMARPRSILAAGAGDVSPLPAPDVSVELRQEALAEGVSGLRRSFAEGMFSPEAADFDAGAVRTATRYACPMHPEVVREEAGSCPVCGMDLVPREVGAGETGHGNGDPGHTDHGEHGSGDTDHGGMGFMSMVEMTEGTPRSSDGLQMEWVEAPFGPLFPGLPGGLGLTLTLDGDTVAVAEVARGIEGHPAEVLTGPAETFPDRLSGLDPLSPVASRVLAARAVEAAAGVHADQRTALARIGALERERAASHLGWLASFGFLIGHAWLARRAGELQLALLRSEEARRVSGLQAAVGRFARRVERAPLLKRRLAGIGTLAPEEVARASGPAARAAGTADDARSEEEVYRSLGFRPVTGRGSDALARLRARLAEVEQSLGLAGAAGAAGVVHEPALRGAADASGTGTAVVETPRGRATLDLILERGTVAGVDLGTPSMRHLALVRPVAEGRELADALVGIASLDLSPWEVVG